MPNLYMIIGIGVAVMVAIFTAYFFYAQNKITKLGKEVAALELSVEAYKKQVTNLEKSAKKVDEINKKLIVAEKQASQATQKLAVTLSKLDNIDPKKKSLLERKINKGSRDRVRCLEIASGAKIQKDEKNSLCPQLLK